MYILRPTLAVLATALLAGFTWIQPIEASCECGYLVSRGPADKPALFTSSILTDFTSPKLKDIGADWQRSDYAIAGQPDNNPPLLDQYYYPSNIYRDSEGLVIRAKAYTGSGPVSGGELQTVRTDILHGSFRATMQTSKVKGVCQSIFFYYNDTQEIDIELLTGHPNDLHFTNQPDTTTTPKAGFNPAAAFHEYRIDWIRGQSEMWVDGKLKSTLTKQVPSHTGEILINNWSNGDPTWSQGPPTKDVLLRVKNVQLYFNHTNAAQNANFAKRCAQATSANRVCQIR